jgi:hypothetical protein
MPSWAQKKEKKGNLNANLDGNITLIGSAVDGAGLVDTDAATLTLRSTPTPNHPVTQRARYPSA